MKTNLSALIRENNELEMNLTTEDGAVLQKIIKYFSLNPVSSMETQELRKDLLGMAQEARQRGECLHDVLGDDIQGFCESVLKNIRKDKAEYRLHMLFTGSWYIFFCYLMDWCVFNSLPEIHGIKFGWVLMILLALVSGLIINKYFEKKIRVWPRRCAKIVGCRRFAAVYCIWNNH